MKYLVVSDVHGDSSSSKFISNLLEKTNFDKVLCLGDLLYHGPRNNLPESYAPKEVISVFNSIKNKLIMVRGNCDAYVDQMVLDFPIVDLAVVSNDNNFFYMTHGHIFNPNNKLNVESDYVLYGHTHIPRIEKVGSTYYLNPGSITLPKGGFPRSYAVLDDNSFIIYDLEGNVIDSLVIE